MKRYRNKVNGAIAIVIALAIILSAKAFALQSSQTNSNGQQQNQSPTGNQPQNQPAPSLKNPGGAPPPAQPQIDPQEVQAYEAIEKETDPDKQIQLVKDFEKKFPNSKLLSDVYFLGAGADEQKNDLQAALTYGQASLKLRPDNLRSLILVAGLLPLPQALQGTAEQKQQQLTTAQNDANHALQLLANLPRQPNIPEDQFQQEKKVVEAQLHSALGMAHLEEAMVTPGAPKQTELTAAEQEYKSAVASPRPNSQDYYRLGEVYTRENKLDDAINAFTQAAQLGQGTLIQKYANDMIARLKAQKAQGAQGAKTPSNPPAAAPAKQE